MRRRDLLGGLLLLLGSGVMAGRADALGGTLPELDNPAPDFLLCGITPVPGSGGRNVLTEQLGLRDFHGRWLVLYFYPKDFTEGCTLEARGFQRDLKAFHDRQAEVVGVSADDGQAHASFCGSEGLTYPLLSDPGGKVSQRYGSWMAPFSQRHSFLIDPEGVLRARWTAVRPAGHSREVLEELDRLRAGTPAA
jgi:peroxiredoxin Q/BCP